MKKIKLLILVGLLFIFAGIALDRKETIISYINYFSGFFKNDQLEVKNEYTKNYDFTFVQNTTNLRPTNYQEIINIYFTALNNGLNEFTFHCNFDYKDCLSDVEKLANSQETLSDINNYVHPFNSFTNIETTYDSLGNVSVSIEKLYSQNDITLINRAVDKIYNKLVVDTNTLEENIKSVHDYIIVNTKYDIQRKQGNSNYRSDSAYGIFYEGFAVCSGYADAMAIFLDKLNVHNFKISSEMHVWNAVYINNKWLNLDLTWDDPVSNDGLDYLEHNYFLIDSNKLLTLEKKEHNFNTLSYPELATQ